MPRLPEFRTPWFICTMATGISTSILFNYPYEARWLKDVSYILFGLCSVSLLTTTVLFTAQLARSPQYRHDAVFDLRHNVFLGCGVMGFTSWTTAMHLVTEHKAPMLSYVLWWISNVLSLGTGWAMVLVIFMRSTVNFQEMTATLLLPVVALTVTAALGGVITPSLPYALRQSTIVVSFLLWSNAMGLAFIILTIYIHRLIIHKFPPKPSIFTSFIPIGFLGQGAFAVQLFGKDFHDLLLSTATDMATQIQADILQYTSVIAGVFLEGLGFCFTAMAIWAVLSHGKHQFHYGWWAVTFPLGTMAVSTHETGSIMDWEAFLVVSAMYGTFVVLFTVFCTCMSLRDVVQWMMSTRTTATVKNNDDEPDTGSQQSVEC